MSHNGTITLVSLAATFSENDLAVVHLVPLHITCSVQTIIGRLL